MIHQQPPPKPPLLPQHMFCHLTFDVPVTETGPDAAPGGAGGDPRTPDFPVTETGSDAAEEDAAAPEPSPVAFRPGGRLSSPFLRHTMWGPENWLPPPGAARTSKE